MGSIQVSRIRQRMRLWGGAEGHGMSGRLLLSSPKPHVPSLTPNAAERTHLHWVSRLQMGQTSSHSYKDGKLKAHSKKMRLKRGSLASPRLPCLGWISKRPWDARLLYHLLTKLRFSQFPFAAKDAQLPQRATLPPYLPHSQGSKCLKCASYLRPSPLEDKMSKCHVNKGTFLLHATST